MDSDPYPLRFEYGTPDWLDRYEAMPRAQKTSVVSGRYRPNCHRIAAQNGDFRWGSGHLYPFTV